MLLKLVIWKGKERRVKCEDTGVDRADGGLLVEAVEAELALVGGGVGQRLGLLGVLLKFFLKNINRASTTT